MATLAELIRLLDYPTFLAEKIRQLKTQESTSEEIAGFIVLYDQCNGDIQKIKNYLVVSKQKITEKSLPKIHRLRWMKYAAVFAVILGIFAQNRIGFLVGLNLGLTIIIGLWFWKGKDEWNQSS